MERKLGECAPHTLTEKAMERSSSDDNTGTIIHSKKLGTSTATANYSTLQEVAQNTSILSQRSHYHKSESSISCFVNSSKDSWHFFQTPVKFFHVAARELSVLLILIETLILLGGYLVILGVHYIIRYILGKLRNQTSSENTSYEHARSRYRPPRPVIPRRIPRGRMAGG